MRKLIESTLMSLDGVVEAPVTWTGRYWDEESESHALAALDRYEAFVFGRITYETFAAMWGKKKGNAYIDRINEMPKYVISNTLRETTTWNARLLQGEVVEEITKLKGQPGKDLIKYGTSNVDRTLITHGLIDELHVWLIPVVVGRGKRIFEGMDPASLKLKLIGESRFVNGSVLLRYAPEP